MTLPSSTLSSKDQDLPKDDFSITRSENGSIIFQRGNKFEDQVVKILKLQGYKLDQNVKTEESEGKKVFSKTNIFCSKKETNIRLFVQVVNSDDNATEIDIKKFIEDVRNARGDDLYDRGLMISKSGYGKTTQDLRMKYRFINFITYDELLADAIDFSTALEKIIKDVDESQDPREPPLSKYYINLKTTPNFDEYIDTWLESNNPKGLHPVILGPYGTGKTTFCKMLARNMAKKYLEGKKPGLRIPILFNLRDFTTELNIDSFVTHHLDKYCGVSVRYELFDLMNNAGLFLLIFDGFDEMRSKVTSNVIQNNIHEIYTLATHPNSKVLITSRPEFFISEEEEAVTLGTIRDPISYYRPRQFYRIKLIPLDQNQIKEYLMNYLPYVDKANKKCDYYWYQIKKIHNLEELSKTPVFLHMIVNTLPELIKDHEENGTEINRSNLYNKYLRLQMYRETIVKGRKLLLDEEERFKLMEGIAITFFINQINNFKYEDIDNLFKLLKKEEIERGDIPKRELDSYVRDLLTCSFLERIGDGYRFSHNSIWEYLTAKSLSKEIRSYNENNLNALKFFGKKILTPIICDFLIEMNLPQDKLLQIILETKNKLPKELRYIGSNACTLLNKMKFNFTRKDLSNTCLEWVDLHSSDLTDVNFTNSILNDANLDDTILHNTNFTNSSLIGASFKEIGCIGQLAFSPKNDFLAISCYKKSNLVIYETKKWTQIKNFLTNQKEIRSISFSPDGKLFAVAGYDDTIKILKVDNWKIFKSFDAHDGAVNCIAFSPDYKFMISGSNDKTIKIWDGITFKEIKTLAVHEGSINYIEFIPNSNNFISGSDDGSIIILDIKNLEIVYKFPPNDNGVISFAISPDGRFLAAGAKTGRIRIFDLRKLIELKTLKAFSGDITSVIFSPDNKYLVSGSTRGDILVWDVKTWAEIGHLPGHTTTVKDLRFTNNQNYLVSGSDDRSIKIWDVAQWKKQLENFHHEHPFKPKIKLLEDGTPIQEVKEFTANLGRCIETLTHDINCNGMKIKNAKLDAEMIEFFIKHGANKN